jgi:WD40 repeat protein
VLCVKTAWHGDRLVSGGADRTVRIWDLAGSGGKCLSTLSGHFGWVTSVYYWGPNTIISASTDRSVALWDIRVSNSPLFVLRHHHAPVSDVLLGPRSDPVMVSAAVDGSIAAWDFRQLTGVGSSENGRSTASGGSRINRSLRSIGPVHLSEGLHRQRKTAFCLGSDALIREWDYHTGSVVNEYPTGHCDTISSFVAIGGDKVINDQLDSAGLEAPTSFISASWDGTVRMRNLVSRNL